MLIQGKYQQARSCLEEQVEHPSDGRYALYKVHVFHIIKVLFGLRGEKIMSSGE